MSVNEITQAYWNIVNDYIIIGAVLLFIYRLYQIIPFKKWYKMAVCPRFTLVELIIVMVIIMMLAGMMVPVYMQVKKGARVQDTRVRMNNIRASIISYKSTYGMFPFQASFTGGDILLTKTGYEYMPSSSTSSTTTTDGNINFFKLIDCLAGANPRGMQFMGADQAYDSWEQPFKIYINTDGDSGISEKLLGNTSAGAGARINGDVHLKSDGPDTDDPDDDIESWD